MSHPLEVKTHRTIPSALVGLVRHTLDEYLTEISILDETNYKLKHYAGEFLAEDNLDNLVADVREFPYVMYDIETIDETDIDASQTMPKDTFGFIIFACVSNVFDASLQWSASYDLAWDVRRAFQGVKFAATKDVTSNGFFVPLSIERELHVPGMSVHTFRMDVEITHDVNGVLSAEGAGFNFELTSNSHYLPLV